MKLKNEIVDQYTQLLTLSHLFSQEASIRNTSQVGILPQQLINH